MDYWKGINALCGRHPRRVVGAGGVIATPNFGRSLNHPSLNTQSCNRRPLCSTFTFENVCSPKNQFYSERIFLKNQKNQEEYFNMQLFCADARIVFPKKFWRWKKVWKNRPQKLLISALNLLLCTGPAAQTAQKQKSRTTNGAVMWWA